MVHKFPPGIDEDGIGETINMNLIIPAVKHICSCPIVAMSREMS